MTEARDTRKNELLDWVRSKPLPEALEALNTLRAEGFLTDGSLEGASLYGVDLRGANLKQARLKGAILSGVDLRETDLRDADFSQTDMIDCKLAHSKAHSANFQKADLIASDLSGVMFWQTDLRGAALGGTDLSGTIFHSARLDHADFNGAKCTQTVFTDVDLSATTNLATIRHMGRSHLDFHTLARSAHALPMAFLRGCGIPEPHLQMLNRAEPTAYTDAFITYTYTEQPFALWIYQALQEQGVRCWLDPHKILPRGQRGSRPTLDLRPTDTIFLIVSEAVLRGGWIDLFLRFVHQQTTALGRNPLVVIRFDDALDTFDSDLATQLQGFPFVTFQDVWGDVDAMEARLDAVTDILKKQG